MKSFTDFFIQRPVFALVINLFVLLVGFIAYSKLAIREYPRIDSSVVTITVTYPGANAKVMESYIATPIENSIAGVEGIDYLSSQNNTGQSVISAHFKLGYPINDAIIDVSDKVNSVRNQLPQDIDPPVIGKEDPNAEPTMYISFSSTRLSPEEISDYLFRVVQPEFAGLDGVGQVKIFGERKYAMRVWLDPEKMSALSITFSDVQSALQRGNIQTAAGKITGNSQELNILAMTDLNTVDQFNNLVISQKGDTLIRLRDIGKAELGAENYNSSVYINDQPSIVIAIIPKSTANPLDVSLAVQAALKQLKQNLPAGLEGEIRWDTSRFIQASLSKVRDTIIEATAFVMIVIFLFLGTLRGVLIPLVTIPLSLVGTGIIMYWLGYTINLLTLLAFVLAIGLVVDDAIVVLENIQRNMEAGLSRMEAAIKGAREIGFAIIAMTFTLASVYAPIGFTEGLTGLLFKEFAFTLAGSVIISGMVALTLSPMMCSRILSGKNPYLAQKIEAISERVTHRYQEILQHRLTLKKSKRIVFLALIIYLAGFLFHNFLRDELAPDEDQGAVLAFVTAPVGSSLAFLESYTNKLIDIFKSIPEQEGYGVINGFQGVNSAIAFLVLTDWTERARSSDDIIGELFMRFGALEGVMAFPTNLPALPTSGFFPVSFVIKTTGSYEDLYALGDKIKHALAADWWLINVDSDLKYNQPQLNLEIDRDKAASLGVSMQDVATTLGLALGEPTVTRFVRDGKTYEVVPQTFAANRNAPNDLYNFYVRTSSQDLIPLANLVVINPVVAPQSYNHFQQARSMTLTASMIPGHTLGDALARIKEVAEKLVGQKGIYSFDYSDTSRQFMQASGTLQFALIFAVLFIFLVLSAQFESFLRPLIVMTSVPLALTGALLTLFLVGATLNIYTKIGLITLVGLITKHGILMVDFATRLQRDGLSVSDAIIKAASLRLRPILMTTSAMVLGAVPLILDGGAGSHARNQIGWVIVGGMSIGTLFTLFVVPSVYFLVYQWFADRKAK